MLVFRTNKADPQFKAKIRFFSHSQLMAGLMGCTAAEKAGGQGRLWADCVEKLPGQLRALQNAEHCSCLTVHFLDFEALFEDVGTYSRDFAPSVAVAEFFNGIGRYATLNQR